jgi:hypothetical protein
VLESFATKYQFNLSRYSLNSREGKAAKALGINAVPAVVIVRKDGSTAFELARGMMSFAELEANVILASKYAAELEKKEQAAQRRKHK